MRMCKAPINQQSGITIPPSGPEAIKWLQTPTSQGPEGLWIDGHPVIESWEKPLMERLGRIVVENRGGKILEVGFGMGWSANAIAQYGCRQHVIIEAHPEIASQARTWASQQKHQAIVLEGFWQDIIPRLSECFDGILFDTCPVSELERDRWHYPFLPLAWDLLEPGGVFTYYSNESKAFRAEHLNLLKCHCPVFELVRMDGHQPPTGCRYWSEDHMMIPVIRKPS